MIQNTKCECGHQNSVGTVLCESCGKPLLEDEGTALLEMRYDGVARRSQKTNPALIDKIWNFFSSVKVAVILILVTLLGSVIGTIYPQENTFMNVDPSTYYSKTYGIPGTIYFLLGFSDTYNSWWYRLLLVMIGASLVICSLDRVLPLYRALSKQKIRKHLQFLTRQKVVYQNTITVPGGDSGKSAEEWIRQVVPHLKKKHYRVHAEGTALLAEKYRFSRWGPYINHIGLIIFLLAVLARGIPGWYTDQFMGFLEGEAVKIPKTNLYLMNEKFTVEYYSPKELPKSSKNKVMPKLFQTKAILYECTANCDVPGKDPVLKEVERHNIVVNKPLEYKGYSFYQFDYEQTPQIRAVKVYLKDKKTGQEYGSFVLRTKDPKPDYKAGDYDIKIKDYYPDFALNSKGLPITKSNNPNSPAFILQINGPGLPKEGDIYLYFAKNRDKSAYSSDQLNAGSRFDISAHSMSDVQLSQYTSLLNVRVDKAMPYIYTGAVIFMIGVVMGLYWQHRRIWLRIDDGNRLTLGAHTNKNWYGLRNDVAYMLGEMGIIADPKSLENGVDKK